jgi:hypothetical protein
MFNWLWQKIKIAIKLMITKTFLFLGFVFTWVIPIYLLSQVLAFTKDYTLGWKFTFVGLIVIGFVAIKFWSKIKAKINSLQPKTLGKLILQVFFTVIHSAGTFAVWFFLLDYFEEFMINFNHWYAISLIFFGIGIICYAIDKIIVFYKEKRLAQIDRENLIKEIKGE